VHDPDDAPAGQVDVEEGQCQSECHSRITTARKHETSPSMPLAEISRPLTLEPATTPAR
jgi:hypothetical protein